MDLSAFIFFRKFIPMEPKLVMTVIKFLKIDLVLKSVHNIIEFLENNENEQIEHDILEQHHKDDEVDGIHGIHLHAVIHVDMPILSRGHFEH